MHIIYQIEDHKEWNHMLPTLRQNDVTCWRNHWKTAADSRYLPPAIFLAIHCGPRISLACHNLGRTTASQTHRETTLKWRHKPHTPVAPRATRLTDDGDWGVTGSRPGISGPSYPVPPAHVDGGVASVVDRPWPIWSKKGRERRGKRKRDRVRRHPLLARFILFYFGY